MHGGAEAHLCEVWQGVAGLDRWKQFAAGSGQHPFPGDRLHKTKFSQPAERLWSNRIDRRMRIANDNDCGAKFDGVRFHPQKLLIKARRSNFGKSCATPAIPAKGMKRRAE